MGLCVLTYDGGKYKCVHTVHAFVFKYAEVCKYKYAELLRILVFVSMRRSSHILNMFLT